MNAAPPRHTYEVLAPRLVQGSDIPWQHEVQVALPPSYRARSDHYPVLWVLDGSLSFSLTVGVLNTLGIVGETPELIVIGIGAPGDSDGATFGSRRIHDLYPTMRWTPDGPGAGVMSQLLDESTLNGGGGAESFQSFLVDDLRPTLAEELRFQPDDHGLVGFSASGHFVAYTLLTRTSTFRRYLAGSPPLKGSGGLLFDLEEKYAHGHKDLPVRLFLSAGEAEMRDPYIAAADVVGSVTAFSQQLTLRNYPRLDLTVRILPGHTHASAQPIALTEGLRALYPVTAPSTEELVDSGGATPDTSAAT